MAQQDRFRIHRNATIPSRPVLKQCSVHQRGPSTRGRASHAQGRAFAQEAVVSERPQLLSEPLQVCEPSRHSWVGGRLRRSWVSELRASQSDCRSSAFSQFGFCVLAKQNAIFSQAQSYCPFWRHLNAASDLVRHSPGRNMRTESGRGCRALAA